MDVLLRPGQLQLPGDHRHEESRAAGTLQRESRDTVRETVRESKDTVRETVRETVRGSRDTVRETVRESRDTVRETEIQRDTDTDTVRSLFGVAAAALALSQVRKSCSWEICQVKAVVYS